MEKKSSRNLKYIFFIFCIYMLLFQNLLQTYIPIIQYFDEILALCLIPILLVKMTKKNRSFKIKKYNLYILLLLLLLISIGLYSSFKYKYQSFGISMSDLLLITKFFLAYWLSELIFDSKLIIDNKEKIAKHIKFIIVLFMFLTVLNYTFKIWPQNSYRFGIMSNQIFYSHPTYLAASCVFLMALLILTSGIQKQKKYLFFILIVLVSTFRFKAIGAAILILFIINYIKNRNKKISITKIGLIAILIILLVWDQINASYIDSDSSARKVLNDTSIKIANDYFPVGSGFATFASHFSAVKYSPIYSIYHINNVWGLIEGEAYFVSDTFWPMIIGQFGYIGAVAYLFMIFFIFRKIQCSYSNSIDGKKIYICKIISLIYLAISSTSETAFVNPIAVPLALILGINIICESRKEINNE